MPPTQHVLHRFSHIDSQSSQNSHRSTRKFGRIVWLTLLLATLSLLVTLSGFVPGRGNQTVSAAQVPQKSSANLSGQDAATCLQNTDWPPAFQVQFTAYFPPGTGYGPWANNTLQYQYDATTKTPQFKATFPKCLNLPGVPLSFFRKSCEFYFTQDNESQWNSYVYSTELQQYFQLASNMGPLPPDFAARYYALLPLHCLNKPRPGSPVPVGNPPNVAVDWFLTSGTRKNLPKSPAGQGYYAAIATPVTGPDGKQYKPPYSFIGDAPGFHRMVYGQLVYEWQNLNLNPSFTAGTFTPPTGYTQLTGTGQSARMNCAACHLSNIKDEQIFYTQTKSNKPK